MGTQSQTQNSKDIIQKYSVQNTTCAHELQSTGYRMRYAKYKIQHVQYKYIIWLAEHCNGRLSFLQNGKSDPACVERNILSTVPRKRYRAETLLHTLEIFPRQPGNSKHWKWLLSRHVILDGATSTLSTSQKCFGGDAKWRDVSFEKYRGCGNKVLFYTDPGIWFMGQPFD